MGIARRRFQGDHYDLHPALRERAVALGAVEVGTGELVQRMSGCAASVRGRAADGSRDGTPRPGDAGDRRLARDRRGGGAGVRRSGRPRGRALRPNRELAEEVAAALPGDGHVSSAPTFADPERCGAMVDEAAAALGGIDVLVNNAGVFVPAPDRPRRPTRSGAGVERTLGVNLIGAANVDLVRGTAHARPAAGGSSTSPRAAPSAASPGRPPTARARPG